MAAVAKKRAAARQASRPATAPRPSQWERTLAALPDRLGLAAAILVPGWLCVWVFPGRFEPADPLTGTLLLLLSCALFGVLMDSARWAAFCFRWEEPAPAKSRRARAALYRPHQLCGNLAVALPIAYLVLDMQQRGWPFGTIFYLFAVLVLDAILILRARALLIAYRRETSRP